MNRRDFVKSAVLSSLYLGTGLNLKKFELFNKAEKFNFWYKSKCRLAI